MTMTMTTMMTMTMDDDDDVDDDDDETHGEQVVVMAAKTHYRRRSHVSSWIHAQGDECNVASL